MTDNISMEKNSDIWFEWLRQRRHGGNTRNEIIIRNVVDAYFQKILSGAMLQPGMTLLDIGCGEGQFGISAISSIGPTLKVIFTDISEPLLNFARQTTIQEKVDEQCVFIQANAENLAQLDDQSVDVVAARSSLTYVSDKAKALKEIMRVVRPGGRISFAEPVFRDEVMLGKAMSNWCDKNPDHPNTPYLRLSARCKAEQFPIPFDQILTNPLTQFTEREWFQSVLSSGFKDVHVELHLDSIRREALSWDDYISNSIHPMAPTLKEIVERKFSEDERQLFERITRENLAKGWTEYTERMVFITANKPKSN